MPRPLPMDLQISNILAEPNDTDILMITRVSETMSQSVKQRCHLYKAINQVVLTHDAEDKYDAQEMETGYNKTTNTWTKIKVILFNL